MSSTNDVITFGCRLNAYESEVMRGHAEAAGLEDAVFINTCAVTSEAERQARQAIRRARRERPSARIVVTGCAAQIDPAPWAAMPEVDQVIGNTEKMDPASFIRGANARIAVNDIMAVREQAGHMLAGFEGRARAFVQVQQGCDHRCTFCIIPFGRGNSRSVPLGDVVAEARRLVGNGYQELVLTGVDLTSYGADLPGQPTLGQAVRRLLAAVPDLPRLRLSSLDPVEIDSELEDLIATEPRVMPHLHLSVQAGDDMILKRMKRRHLRDDVIKLTRRLKERRSEIVFGADIIAGFPTETDAMFQRSLDLVDEAGLTWLHVFPYSPRPGTPATQMPQVDGAVRRERAACLRAAGAEAVTRHLAGAVGASARVLIETDGAGRTETYAPVSIEGEAPDGALLVADIIRSDGERLFGRAA
ncbi:MAG: tRNA (N(6)-L-threonylcarbamoyladenosine(37)-C(2))-methylthiotransferase MtaB [Alphaproteobacteria bacterium]|nr:tRNA (N(6)-L-threonylcarbamoyladenosine(37)-C(2))-methylthiotransferase MtaB [Alphaproteobacteria bacterium]